MQTKYNIGQIVKVKTFDIGYGLHTHEFEIKSITILKDNILYHPSDNGTGLGVCEESIIEAMSFKDEGTNI